MLYKIREIPRIGIDERRQLMAVGIETTKDLLQRCGSSNGRVEIARRTGIDASRLEAWGHMADLMRLGGIGRQFVELLHRAGVASIQELALSDRRELAATIRSTNATTRLAKSVPSETQIGDWIEAARQLRPAMA